MKKPGFRAVRYGWRRLLNSKVVGVDGVRLHACADFVPRPVQTALFKGTYEGPERRLLKAVLRPGHRVLEVGAGIGLTGLLATRTVGEGRVLSYEPNPALERVIEANFRLNGLAPNLRMKALTSDGRDVRFFQNANLVGSSIFDRGLKAAPLMVGSDAIGEVVAAHRPDVIVMDAEGAEAELLPAVNAGAIAYLLVEFHPDILGADCVNSLVSGLGEAGLGTLTGDGRIVLFGRRA